MAKSRKIDGRKIFFKKVLEQYIIPKRYYIPRISMGQHKLVRRDVLKRIASFAGKGEVVIEIGGGEGNLTEFLKDRAELVITFEPDSRYIDAISEKVDRGVILVLADFISFDILSLFSLSQYDEKKIILIGVTDEDLRRLSETRKFRIVSNIPFYISSQLIHKVVVDSFFISGVHILVQREFAHKISAQPGDKIYSAISVITQFFYTVKIEFDVPPHFFSPKPDVFGTFISLEPRYRNIELFDKGDIHKSRKLISAFIDYTYSLFRRRKRKIQGIEGRRVYTISPEEVFRLFERSI